MQSWGELWLNEGFASYFEYAGATAGERERACTARLLHPATPRHHTPPTHVRAESTGFDVGAAMQQWTYRAGYPVVTASADAQGRVWLQQAPFALDGVKPCDPGAAWWVPVGWAASRDPPRQHWVSLSQCQSSTPLAELG